MAIIPTIQDSVEPQGKIEIMRRGQADASDFGGQMAQGLGRIGSGLDEAAGQIQQYQTTQDVTGVYKNMAQARADWTQNLQDRAAQAQPGDDTFAPKLMKDMSTYFEQGAASAATPRGQQIWAQQSAEMASQFGQKAIEIQAGLTAQAAVNDFNDTIKSHGLAVGKDETQLPAALDEVKGLIYNPDSMFSRIPAPERDKMWQQAQAQLNRTAGEGYTDRNPGKVLQALDPTLFNAYAPYLKTNAVPGGNVSISPATMAKAPDIVPAASSLGVNPNIVMAQVDAGGTTPQEPKELASSMATLLGAYSGNYMKSLLAYHAGTDAVDSAMRFFGSDWQTHVAEAAQSYAQNVLTKAGAVPSPAPLPAMVNDGQPAPAPAAPAEAGPREPVAADLPFKLSSFEDQAALSQRAVTLVNLQMNMADRARKQIKDAQADAIDTKKDAYLQQILDPATNGKFDLKGMINDPILDATTRNNLYNIYNAKVDKARSDSENQTNPAVFHNLMVEIHAADSDPTKVYSDANAWSAFSNRQISFKDFNTLRNEVTQMKDGNQNPFQQQVHSAKEMVYNFFTKDLTATLPNGMGPAQDAYYRFQTDLDAKIADYRAQGKNPRTLLDPSAPDYALKPETIASFKPDAKTVIANGAAKVIEAAKLDRTPAPGFKLGETRVVNGKPLIYQGGPINLSTSWGPSAPVPGKAAAPAPASDPLADLPSGI